ncbi:DUF4913 domain-containing protein [Sphaerisporangium flaviroseum]|uniref:DUF4913 domain-containing protein n=1 Tax=Sphaerisporangium flaviroseum TaxID=509199 RepID=A0ABP7JFB4_9ACTN
MTPESLERELADLSARLAHLEAELRAQQRHLDELDQLDPDPGGHAEPQQNAAPQEGAGPIFLLLLEEPLYQQEMELLAMWVQQVLIPVYVAEPTPTMPWCPRWWKHPTALARLHALWLAWQERTDPEAGGFTGPADWHRDYLDSTLAVLRAPDGPFSGCSTDPRGGGHRDERPAPTDRYLDDDS